MMIKKKLYIKPEMTEIPFVAKPLLQITSPAPTLPFGDSYPTEGEDPMAMACSGNVCSATKHAGGRLFPSEIHFHVFYGDTQRSGCRTHQGDAS